MSDAGGSAEFDAIEAGLRYALHDLRLLRGLSRRELAEASGITADAIAKLERGDRTRPTDKTLHAIAAALGLEVDELLDHAAELGASQTAGHAHSEPAQPPPTRQAGPDETVWGRRRPGDRRRPDPRSQRLAARHRSEDPRVEEVLAAARVLAADHRTTELDLVAWLLATLRHDAHDLDDDAVRWLRTLITQALSDPPGAAERLAAARALLRDPLDADPTLDEHQVRRLLDYAHHLWREETATADRPRVATIPPEQPHYVFANALGLDDHQHVWINPLATARPSGQPTTDPRIWRLADGQILVDLTETTEATLTSPDPQRHHLRATPVPPLADVPTTAYQHADLTIDWPDSHLTITAAEPGHTEGTYPHGITSLHVLTAHNPHAQLHTPQDNQARNDALRADLDTTGHPWHPATIRSPNPHQPWHQDAFAIIDADRDHVIALARHHGQHAIFEWTPHHRALVRTHKTDAPEDQLIEALGWHAHWDAPA